MRTLHDRDAVIAGAAEALAAKLALELARRRAVIAAVDLRAEDDLPH